MKKNISLTIFLSLFFCLTVLGQNGRSNGAKGNGNNNEETGRTNLILPHGNIGLGTLHPTEKLEVIGNVKVSQSIFAHDLDVIGLSATTFTVREDASIGRNLFVQGNVGVGIQNPAEKMEIGGNLKVTQGIFSQSMTTEDFTGATGLFSGNLGVQQNFNVDGHTGLGVASPTERLEVAGNIKATQGMLSESVETNIFTGNTGTFTGTLTANENLLLNGMLGVGVANPGEKIDVNGNIKASQNLIASGLQTGTGDFSSSVSIGQDLLITGNTGLGVANPTEKLDVAGNIKASGNILSQSLETTTFTGGDGSFSNNLTIRENLVTNGFIGIGVASPTEKLDVLGNIKSSGSISAQSIDIDEFNSTNGSFSGNLAVEQNFTVNGLTGLGMASPTEKLDVAGNVKVSGDLLSGTVKTGAFKGTEGTFSNNLSVGQNLGVQGNITSSGSISAQSIDIDNFNSTNGSFSGNLAVGQNFTVNGLTGLGVASPTEKLDVAGNVKLSGDLHSGTVKTGAFTGTEGTFSNNLSVGQNLGVQGDITSSGSISAQSIDIDNFNSKNGTFAGNLSVGQDFTVNGLTGLGVALPTEKLDVAGNVKLTGNLVSGAVNTGAFTGTEGAFSNNLTVGQNLAVQGNITSSGSLSAASIQIDNFNSANGSFSGNLAVAQNITVGGTASFTGDLNAVSSLSVGGKLGIGVPTPQAALHVGSDARFDGNVTAQKLVVQELEAANVNFNSPTGEAATFANDVLMEGNVGIGTDNTDGAKLTVAGRIRAQEIKINTNAGADFVFEEDYKLRSLEELEQFVRTNKRLPEIASEKDMVENGLPLGEMNIRLLQKVEELSLYLIEQNKELKRLKEENENQAKRLEELEGKVK